MKTPGGLRLDSPSWPMLQASISYWDVTTANGNVLGTTIVCANLVNEPSYQGLSVKLLDGAAAGQVRTIATHPAGTNTLTVANAFTDNAGAVVQVVAGTRFVILSAGGGGGVVPPVSPGVSLWMFGICDPGMAASLNTLVLTNLAGFPDDIFNNEFWVQVIHNTDNPGAAPEREIRRVTNYVGATGTFTTDDFTANVEANDLVAVFHESIMAIEILGFGTLDTSSATVPADSARAEVDNYFNGCLLMTTEGAVRFQPRRIVDYTGAGGIFTLDPSNPFTGVPGLVDYVIIGDQTQFVPGANSANNYTPADVIGNKTDTALQAVTAADSLMRYIKGLINGQSRVLCEMVFWSNSQEEVQLGAAPATIVFTPTVTVADIPAGATVVRAILLYKFRMIENSNQAVNSLNGATVAATSQVIQVDDSVATGYIDGINFVDTQFGVAGSTREGGDVCVGSIDVSARVDGNDVYTLRWLLSRAQQDNLNFNDVQVGIKLWYQLL